MFGFKKTEVKTMDINEGYQKYVADPEHHVIICVDELIQYDALHIAGAECLPVRLFDKVEEYYPDKDLTYYVYSNKALLSSQACKKMTKKGFQTYDLGAYLNFKGEDEGTSAKRKRRKGKKVK